MALPKNLSWPGEDPATQRARVRAPVNLFRRRPNCKTVFRQNACYFEEFTEISSAIQRETSLKRLNRKWKLDLIEMGNPDSFDLYERLSG